jgi:hypothetical protein
MRRYSILQAVPLSFFSGDLYRDVARSWRGIGLAYLVLLVALLTLVVVIRMHLALAGWVNRDAREFVGQVPRIVIRRQVVEVDGAMPLTIRDSRTGAALAIIDTTGAVTSLDGQEARVLMTGDHIFYRKSVAETRVFNLSGVTDFTVDSARAGRWLGIFATWGTPIATPFVFGGLFCFRLLQQLLLALVGLLVGRLARVGLDFSGHMRLAAVALTPALVIEPLLELFGARPSWWGTVWIAVALACMVWAVRANRAAPTETALPAAQA